MQWGRSPTVNVQGSIRLKLRMSTFCGSSVPEFQISMCCWTMFPDFQIRSGNLETASQQMWKSGNSVQTNLEIGPDVSHS